MGTILGPSSAEDGTFGPPELAGSDPPVAFPGCLRGPCLVPPGFGWGRMGTMEGPRVRGRGVPCAGGGGSSGFGPVCRVSSSARSSSSIRSLTSGGIVSPEVSPSSLCGGSLPPEVLGLASEVPYVASVCVSGPSGRSIAPPPRVAMVPPLPPGPPSIPREGSDVSPAPPRVSVGGPLTGLASGGSPE